MKALKIFLLTLIVILAVYGLVLWISGQVSFETTEQEQSGEVSSLEEQSDGNIKDEEEIITEKPVYDEYNSEDRKRKMINERFDSYDGLYVYDSLAEFLIEKIAEMNEEKATPNPIECELYIKGVKKDTSELLTGWKRYKVKCSYGSDGYINKVTLIMD